MLNTNPPAPKFWRTSKLPPFLHLGRQKILETVSDLLGFLYIKIYLTIILLLNLLNWIIVRVINTKISQEPAVSSAQDLFIILHYNVDFGVDLIGDVRRVYIIPLFCHIGAYVNPVLFSQAWIIGMVLWSSHGHHQEVVYQMN